MKTRKILLALVTTVLMVLTLCIPALAADTYTITITPNSADKATHTYEAYQIFSGDLSESTLSNIQWGTGVVPEPSGKDTLIEALAAENTVFTGCTDAAAVAEKLADPSLTANDLIDIAKVFGDYLSDTHTDGETSITGLAAGYYLVKDKDAALDKANAAYTNFILKVVADVKISVKSEIPTIDKNITEEGAEPTKSGTYSIGDDIPFTLTSKVPNMNGYNAYYFVINDTMSEGLTFNDDVAISILDEDGKSLKDLDDDAFTVTANAEDGTVKIVLKNFIQYNTEDYIGKEIAVTYTCRLNENAEIGDNANNANTVTLTFSNNPNYKYDNTVDNPPEPDPENPDSNVPVGETPPAEALVYTSGIQLVKVDSDTLERLDGAEFTITGDGVKDTVKITYSYAKDAEGTYYKLADGSYTETAPTEATKNLYDSEDTYKLTMNITTVSDKDYTPGVGLVGDDGVISFVGLNAGTYTISETATPEGYNSIEDFQIEIAAKLSDAGCAWSAKLVEDDTALSANDENLFEVIVKNSKGAILPATGGIGTKLFYIIGSILVLSAVVVFITQKRMRVKEK